MGFLLLALHPPSRVLRRLRRRCRHLSYSQPLTLMPLTLTLLLALQAALLVALVVPVVARRRVWAPWSVCGPWALSYCDCHSWSPLAPGTPGRPQRVLGGKVLIGRSGKSGTALVWMRCAPADPKFSYAHNRLLSHHVWSPLFDVGQREASAAALPPSSIEARWGAVFFNRDASV